MSKGQFLVVCIVWLMIVGVGAAVWRLAFAPARQAAEAERQQQAAVAAEQIAKQRLDQTSAPSRYKHEVNFHLDSFSGYAILRSDRFAANLRDSGIRINLVDDAADYGARFDALRKGDAQMASFTVDALIKLGAQFNDMPATIVCIIDETVGADAIVAYKDKIPNIDALNHEEMKFVLTPDSPSETLARVVMSRFNLENLDAKPFVIARDAGDVFVRYKSSKPTDPAAYVLWEPYVSQMLANDKMHVVVNSSHFPSTIVDVIVASRDFLVKQPDVVRAVVKAYLTTAYEYRDREQMLELITEDAAATGSPLNTGQSEKLVDGIWWKNTLENRAHFGLYADSPLPHIEDIIANLTKILQSTGAIDHDPSQGNANYLYYLKTLEDLSDFHPGDGDEKIRDVRMPALSEVQWKTLTGVGIAKVPPLVFARGTDRLTGHSERVLDELAASLTATRFYVSIVGHASTRGDMAQNKLLAERRAKAAEDYLVAHGVDANRIRAVGSEPSGSSSVTFFLGQLPY